MKVVKCASAEHGDSGGDRQAVAAMDPATATEKVIEAFQSLLEAVRAAIDGRQQFRELKEKARPVLPSLARPPATQV